MKKLFGIIGNPIDHSLSPVLHKYWFRKYDINGLEMHLLAKTWRDDRPQSTQSNKSEIHLLQQQCLVLIRM